ncbi:hypothetical protein [Paraclostridium sp.]|uniref:hypothetical protein n=1 Tax=Paraclostridium sp. TaxID=2023273 RepID=UPI003F34C8C1
MQKDIKFIYEINLNLDKVKIDKMHLSDALLHIIRANIKIDILYSNNLGEGCFLKETLPIVLRSKELNSIDNISILTINLEKNNDSLIMFFSICIIGENSSCISNFKYTNVKSTSIIETTKALPYDSTLDFL